MSTQKVTDPVIDGVFSSVLTGTLPVLDGSALTGIAGFVDTTNANDPETNTNPGTGVGTVWVNSTSGEMFICTDATTDANVWTNIGAGSGDVVPFEFQGTISGYSMGHNVIAQADEIDKFSLVSNTNATDVGNLTMIRMDPAEGKSSTHGYSAGGYGGGTYKDRIDKFTFASDNDATDVANLTLARYYATGQASSTHSYLSGGNDQSNGNTVTRIDKYSTSSDTDATVAGQLTVARQFTSAQCSEDHGYTSVGQQYGGPPYTTVIDRFTFASDNDATDHGDSNAMNQTAGQSSTTHGYITGGYNNGSNFDSIYKFAFASNVSAADQGNLTVGVRWSVSGHSSTTHGYTSGGYNGSAVLNIIDKHAFANNNNATDVGDLVSAKCQTAGTQN